MKKFFLSVLVLSLSLYVVGCSKDTAAPKTPTTPTTKSTEGDKDKDAAKEPEEKK